MPGTGGGKRRTCCHRVEDEGGRSQGSGGLVEPSTPPAQAARTWILPATPAHLEEGPQASEERAEPIPRQPHNLGASIWPVPGHSVCLPWQKQKGRTGSGSLPGRGLPHFPCWRPGPVSELGGVPGHLPSPPGACRAGAPLHHILQPWSRQCGRFTGWWLHGGRCHSAASLS